MNFKKLIILQILQNFRKSPAAHTKFIVCVIFYVNMFDKTPCNLMSPFSNDIFFFFFYLFGIYFRFLRETLKMMIFGNVSGNSCESDCRSRGREFDPGPVPYFRGD